jgi:hypothetical protein
MGGDQVMVDQSPLCVGCQHRATPKGLRQHPIQGQGVGQWLLDAAHCLTNSIAVLGEKITGLEIVKKMLHVAPEPLEQVAISIETLLDLDSLSVEEVASHLSNVEQHMKTAIFDR